MFNCALFDDHRALWYRASQQKFVHKMWSTDIWRSGVGSINQRIGGMCCLLL